MMDQLCQNPQNFEYTLHRINLRKLVNSSMKEEDKIEPHTTFLKECFEDSINQNVSLMRVTDVNDSNLSEQNMEQYFENQPGSAREYGTTARTNQRNATKAKQ